jgi:putative tryptophan/tyrosine transport system substrate-binding protein
VKVGKEQWAVVSWQKRTGEKRMDKKILVWLLATFFLASASHAEAQQAGKVFRIGYLSGTSSERQKSRLVAFQQGLRDLGYVEGKNIIIEYRNADRYEQLPELVAELIRLNVDILVAAGAPAAHAAKSATKTIPIVMQSGDPVGTGLVTSLARPGGNNTGLSDFTVGVVTKRLELLKEVVPSVSRVAVLWNPTNPANLVTLKETQAVAPALGVTLLSLEVKGSDDIDRAFTAMRKERPGALIVFGGVITTHARRIAELAVKSRLPTIYAVSEDVDAGGLMSYGTNFDDLFRRAAVYVDKILKGAKPADLPVEQPTKFEFVINLKAAKHIGLTIPPNVLARADKVIK